MAGLFEVRYRPRDVPNQHLVVRVVRVAVRKVHRNLRLVGRHVERRPHAPVNFHLLGTSVVFDSVPRAFDLKSPRRIRFLSRRKPFTTRIRI